MRQVIAVGIVIIFFLSGTVFAFGEGHLFVDNNMPPATLNTPLGYTPFSVIRINNDQEFLSMKANESWNGSGSIIDPIIIEGYEINAMDSGNCIYIGNITTLHFIVRNCKLTNASGWTLPSNYGAGITLYNIPNIPYPKGILDNNICINNDIGICLYGTNFCLVKNNTCSNNTRYGIYVDSSDNNIIINNTCNSNTFSGIFQTVTNFNQLQNNTCKFNGQYGIEMLKSILNGQILNNSCSHNNYTGIYITNTSDNNKLDANICSFNNMSGIHVNDYSKNNIMSANTCNFNNISGIRIRSDSNNALFNNCSFNTNGSGIDISLSDMCDVINNSVQFNLRGISITEHSDANDIINNTCLNNSDGVFIDISDNNRIRNNHILFNSINGIKLVNASAYNYIKVNNISTNTNGINITGTGLASVLNFFSSNRISDNSNFGIYIDNGNDNEFSHNNILFNTIQTQDSGSNDWNNINNEGNYWSDYTGLDNGSGGRLKGDGIGDTDIPHLGLDNYPFIIPWGWKYVPKPELFDPGEYIGVHNYTIKWNVTPRANGYILEEDTNWSFDSPVEVYNGTQLSIELSRKDNATYYYRLKAFNQYSYSNWSDTVEIIVDWLPATPTGLTAIQPTGHTINLIWPPHPNPDIQSIEILMNDTNSGASGPYGLADVVSNTTTQYLVQNLVEETTYHFVIRVKDKYTYSQYSNVASATTGDETAPAPPTNFTATAISDTKINLNWNASTEPDIAGYLVYMAQEIPNATYQLIQKIAGLGTSYLVTGLDEEFGYFFKLKAFDEVPNNSSFSEIAFAETLDISPPTKPVGLKVTNPKANALTISWEQNPEIDLIGYYLYRTDDPEKNFSNLTVEPITSTQYNDTGLMESTTYYYKLLAIDDAGLVSPFTNIVPGTTLTLPKPPVINISVPDFNITEDSTDEFSINLYRWFKDPNNEKIIFRVEGKLHLNVSINQNTGKVFITPEKDWNGNETLTFFASDKTGEISDSVTITVIGVNDAPGPVEITVPSDGDIFAFGENISFEGSCYDPDVIYGDELTFNWHSSRDGPLGTGQDLSGITLSAGQHIITLNVTDSNAAKSKGTIKIIIQDGLIEIEPEPEEDSLLLILILIVIIIAVLLVVAFALIYTKKKKKREEAERAVGETIRSTLQPGPDVVGLKLPPEDEGFKEAGDEDGGMDTPQKLKKTKSEAEEHEKDELDKEIERELAQMKVDLPDQEQEQEPIEEDMHMPDLVPPPSLAPELPDDEDIEVEEPLMMPPDISPKALRRMGVEDLKSTAALEESETIESVELPETTAEDETVQSTTTEQPETKPEPQIEQPSKIDKEAMEQTEGVEETEESKVKEKVKEKEQETDDIDKS